MSDATKYLIRKLELFGILPNDDKDFLTRVLGTPFEMAARTSIIREGDPPSDVLLVARGLACRSKTLEDGGRQTFAYLLPGDLCDLNVFLLRSMDHDIETVADSTIVRIPRRTILDMMDRPALARALWWTSLVDAATLREWVVNLGKREAEERIAHLLCELHLRMRSIDLIPDGSLSLPITQIDLADAVGVSPVHANRSVQRLKRRGLVELRARQVHIPDIEALRDFASFNANYLHLEKGKTDPVARRENDQKQRA